MEFNFNWNKKNAYYLIRDSEVYKIFYESVKKSINRILLLLLLLPLNSKFTNSRNGMLTVLLSVF